VKKPSLLVDAQVIIALDSDLVHRTQSQEGTKICGNEMVKLR
jgi:hypothetical protein